MTAEARRLAAIVVGDIVGYSAMMEANEADTLSRVFALRDQLLEPEIEARGGRIVKTTGDGFLAEFPSVVGAVEAAVAIQRGLVAWPDVGEPLRLRIGVHVGDVVVRSGDIFGDGVNIAARLEQAADAGGILVSDAVHEQLVGHEIGSFTDRGMLELKNIARGVRAWRWTIEDSDIGPPAVRPSSKPSIAVLPFENLSAHASEDHLAGGIVQDLIAALSRFHWFRVKARASVASLRTDELGPLEVGARLGAQYILEGTVQRSADRIRVTVELVEVDPGTHLWSDRFEGTIEDLFEVQDQIVAGIVGAVVPEFVAVFRPVRGRRSSTSSWELSMRGWNLVWRLDGSEDTLRDAQKYFEQALSADQDDALAWAGLAFVNGNPFYLTGLPRNDVEAMRAARRAVELDDRDAFAWCLLGAAHMWRHELDEAERHVRRSIEMNPSLALAAMYMSSICCWRSDPDGSDMWASLALELSPADPMQPFATISRAMARFGAGDYRGAADVAQEALAMAPRLPSAWRILAASLEALGDHTGAVRAVDRLLGMQPVTISWARENLTPFTDPDRWSAYLTALSSAGVPD